MVAVIEGLGRTDVRGGQIKTLQNQIDDLRQEMERMRMTPSPATPPGESEASSFPNGDPRVTSSGRKDRGAVMKTWLTRTQDKLNKSKED